MKTLLLLTLLFFTCRAKPETVTLTARATGTQTNIATFTVKTNQIAQVLAANLPNAPGAVVATLVVEVGGSAFEYLGTFGSAGPTVAGPATLTVRVVGGGGPAFATVRVSPNTAEEQFAPSNAVVIPADTNGPVTVALESSTDLVNWVPALPGTYGTTTEKRFFRVRAQR